MPTAKELFERLRAEDPELRREYDRLGPRFEEIDALVKARKQERDLPDARTEDSA